MKRWLSITGICVALGLLLGFTQWQTAPAIQANRQAQALATLRQLVAPQSIATAQITSARQGLGNGGFWPMCVDTLVAQTTATGYGGPINLLIRYSAGTCINDQCDAPSITRVLVVQHSETPGIGDFFERQRPYWLQQLQQLKPTLPGQPAANQDAAIDAVSGATITANALINTVRANVTAASAIQFSEQPCATPDD